MKLYLLWFNEWESNYVLGVFDSKEQAEKWKKYFIANPLERGYVAPDMKRFSEKNPIDWEGRFEIEECGIGVNANIKIDNLKYLEWCEKNA